jgi:hypothetical protein
MPGDRNDPDLGEEGAMKEPGTHKLTEAMEGQMPAPVETRGGPHGPPGPTGHGSTPREVAEATRRGQESRDNGKSDLDRENHLVQVGRGQQTHG